MTFYLVKLFSIIRRKYCPQRLYKYGILGLEMFDDRTFKEKAFDWVGNKLTTLIVKQEQRRTDQGFRPYFDWSLGLWINQRGAIKDIERSTGLEYVTVKDWEKESAKQRAYKDKAFEDKLEKRIVNVMKDINQGRSFIKEKEAKRKEIYSKYGKRN